MMTQVFILLSGLPGTGKSSFGAALADRLHAVYFAVDEIESAVLTAGLRHGHQTGLAAYVVAQHLTDEHLGRGHTVVADAVNDDERARQGWRDIGARHDLPMHVLECVCSDQRLHRARLADRDRGLAFPEPTWESVRRRRWRAWPETVIRVDSVRPLEENLVSVLGRLGVS